MSQSSILETIEDFWKARMADDTAAVVAFLSPNANYEMVGANAFADPIAAGPGAGAAAAERLIGDFHFHRREQLWAVVEGRKAATADRLTVSFRGGPQVDSDLCDLWEFDADGKVASLRQFTDTDLIRRMIKGQV